LGQVEDPRRTDRGNIRHKLEDIIIIGLCTLICDGNDFTDMEEFGIQRQELLRQFLELPNWDTGQRYVSESVRAFEPRSAFRTPV